MPLVHRPNILCCVFDSLSRQDCEQAMQAACLPACGQLQKSSRQYPNTYTACPEGSPARASLFTGLDPCVHGVWTNGVALPVHETTFPSILAQAGYAAWLAGRWQLSGVSHWTSEGLEAGDFSDTAWAHGPLHRSRQNAWLDWLAIRAPALAAGLFESQADPDDTRASEHQHRAVSALPDELSFNHWIGQRIIQWIAGQPHEQPFLAVAGFSVEASMGAEPQHEDDAEQANPQALRQAVAAIEQMLAAIDASGRTDDTVVVVTSARGNREPGPAHRAMSESAIRVPLLLHVPGVAATVTECPVSTLDIAPTIIEAAGLAAPARMQGRSLLHGSDTSPEASSDWALCRLRSASNKQARTWQTALRAADMKLVMTHAAGDGKVPASYQLFDLVNDPQESNDLSTHPEHADTLEFMIDTMIDARCAREDRTEPRIAEF